MNGERYEVRFQPAARRAIAGRLPESVALSPRRVGKPLFGPLAGCHGARRGTYRVVYRIDEQARVVEVLDIDHRADIYHRSLAVPRDRVANSRVLDCGSRPRSGSPAAPRQANEPLLTWLAHRQVVQAESPPGQGVASEHAARLVPANE